MKMTLEKSILKEYESLCNDLIVKNIKIPYKYEDMAKIIHNIAIMSIIKVSFSVFILTSIALFIMLSTGIMGIVYNKITVVIVSVLFILINLISIFIASEDSSRTKKHSSMSYFPETINNNFFLYNSFFDYSYIPLGGTALYLIFSYLICLNYKNVISFFTSILNWVGSFNSASIILLAVIGAGCVAFLILYFYKKKQVSDLLKNKVED